MTRTVYMIRDKVTGLFSTGGSWPRWTKKGKVWASKGDLNSHFALFDLSYAIKPYSTAEIVEIQMTEIGTLPITF